MLTDGRDLLRRSDVPARRPGWIVIESEVIPKITLFRGKAVSAAHETSFYPRHETLLATNSDWPEDDFLLSFAYDCRYGRRELRAAQGLGRQVRATCKVVERIVLQGGELDKTVRPIARSLRDRAGR